MRVTRLYTGSDGESHFEDIDIPLDDLSRHGKLSKPIAATSVLFRETTPDHDFSWHNAPRRQFVVMLSGGSVEIEVGDGTKRVLGPGDVLLAEDTTGRGHQSRDIGNEPRISLFIPLE